MPLQFSQPTNILDLSIQDQLTLLDTLIESIGHKLPQGVFEELEDKLADVSGDLIPSIRVALDRYEDELSDARVQGNNRAEYLHEHRG